MILNGDRRLVAAPVLTLERDISRRFGGAPTPREAGALDAAADRPRLAY